jgi:hypothetical protein
MKLSHHGALSVLEQLFAVSSLLATLAQPKQSNENVSLGILVAEECLPSAVGDVVSSDQLQLIRLKVERLVRSVLGEIPRWRSYSNFVVDLVQTDFAVPDVSASESEISHSLKSKLAKVSILNSGRDERHWDVPIRRKRNIKTSSTSRRNKTRL